MGRTLTPEQKVQPADIFGAEGRYLSADRELLVGRRAALLAVANVQHLLAANCDVARSVGTGCRTASSALRKMPAERRAKTAQPHLEQARRALNLRGDLQLRCDVTHTEQDNGLPMVTAEAKFFTEKRDSGYGGFTYADEVELNFEISLAEMAEDGDEPEQAWRALQTSRQTCQQQTDLLIAWRKKLAEIPYVQRRPKPI